MADELRNVILNYAIEAYGIDHQQDMCIEEMSELTKAILKYRRADSDAEKCVIRENVIEEMADVQIMLDQMRIIFGDTSSQEEYKLNRLWARMEAG
nr:hypothetical protein [Oscillospiraceae bacterium]